MKKLLSSTLITATILSSLSISSVVFAAELLGQNFSDQVAISGTNYVLNGLGVRKAMGFVKVYVAGLYVSTPAKDVPTVLKNAKRIELRMLRDVEVSKLKIALLEGFEENFTEAEQIQYQGAMNQLVKQLESFEELKEGTTLTLDAVKAGVQVTSKGKNFTVAIPFNALLRIWIGNNPVDNGLKKALLGNKG